MRNNTKHNLKLLGLCIIFPLCYSAVLINSDLDRENKRIQKRIKDSISDKIHSDRLDSIVNSISDKLKDKKFELYTDSMVFYLVVKQDTLNGARFRDSIIKNLQTRYEQGSN